MTIQNAGSMFDGMKKTVAIPIANPKRESCRINFQFTSGTLSSTLRSSLDFFLGRQRPRMFHRTFDPSREYVAVPTHRISQSRVAFHLTSEHRLEVGCAIQSEKGEAVSVRETENHTLLVQTGE